MIAPPYRLADSQQTFPPIGAVKNIVFPGPGEIRARKVVTRSRQRATGLQGSRKVPHLLEWESAGEQAAFQILEADPAVIRYSDQPCRIQYLQGGVNRIHIPDVLVEFAEVKEFWEIKTRAESCKPDIVERTELMRDLAHWGYGYRLMLSEDLRSQPRLQNATRLIYWGRTRAVSPTEREFIRLNLIQRHELTWGDACAGAYGPSGREILCRLTMEGMLSFQLASRWTDRSVFVSGKEGR